MLSSRDFILLLTCLWLLQYSLPLPKGGREGALKNPILREDQLPRKLINPKSKKASSTEVIPRNCICCIEVRGLSMNSC